MKKKELVKPIRLLELFSGIGAPRAALRNLGIPYVSVGSVEIDPKAVKSYNAIFKNDYVEVPQDISDWHFGVDVMVTGSPCFVRNTLVLTKDGFKEIADVKIGDEVVDKNGNYQKVLASECTGIKEIWKVKPTSSDEIRCTKNHKFLVRTKSYTRKTNPKTNIRVFSSPYWKECQFLTKDDYLGIPINSREILPEWDGVECTCGKKGKYIKKNLDVASEDLWYLVGRYLGDGWVRTRKERNGNLSGIIICCGKHKADDFERLISTDFPYTKVEDRTVYKYQFPNKELAAFMSQFGRGAKNKFLPSFVMDLPINLAQKLLEGYMDSDGHEDKRDNKYCVSSISRLLIYGISQLIMKVYKRPVSIYKCSRPKTHVIEGRTVNQNDFYRLSYKTESQSRRITHAFFEDGFMWVPVKKVQSEGVLEEVYDLTVENTHSFTANNVIVHNCQSFSISGKREGGEKDSGTQSSLLWHTIRIIEEMGSLKPKVVIWENVKNVLSKKMKPTFDQYISEMERLGYVSSYECLDAKDFGLPQRRPRVYTISILGGPKFDFSKLERKEMRPLSEFLDKEINEKYIANSEEIFKELYPYLLNQPSLIECLGKKGIRRTSIIDDCAYAITCRQDRSPAQVVKIEDNNYRFLTEKECWRLQGFSDEDFIAAKSVNPSREGYKSSILYKQAGNSMAVPVLEEIFDKLDLKERKESEVEKAKENKY